MINAADLKTKGLDPLDNLKKLFPKINKKISFVRFACHFDDIEILSKCIFWLRKNKIDIFINIMQISEIKKKEIKKIFNYLKKNEIDKLYFADSLGCLNLKSLSNVFCEFRKYWNKKSWSSYIIFKFMPFNSLFAIKKKTLVD